MLGSVEVFLGKNDVSNHRGAGVKWTIVTAPYYNLAGFHPSKQLATSAFWVHAGTQARFKEGYRRIAEVTKMDG
jgi:hypothetical protein